ncbi:MAG: hypothetical protein M3R49_01080 [Chloroflexota bacterium]|nr:hypothetical protein [Chloroflexota bacterium]
MRAARALAIAVTLTLALVVPAGAHALGQSFQLPVPLGFYLTGAGTAVAASFVVTALVARRATERPLYPRLALPKVLARAVRPVLAGIGLIWWLGAILGGYLIGGISNLPAVLFWIGIWVGLPITAALLGNPWPSLSPFRTLFAIAERGAQLLGFNQLDAGLRYPSWLARWPAAIILFGGLWAELVLPASYNALTVANLLLAYTVLTLAGMTFFGRVAWLRNVELFEVLLGWFGRIGPIGRRTVATEVCADCEEGCDPDRCFDCPECAVAAGVDERRAELRPWFAGLAELRSAGWSDAAFILLALAGVSFDGLNETVAWGQALNLLFPPFLKTFGPLWAVQAVGTLGLAGLWLAFMLVFFVAVVLTRSLGDERRRVARPLGDTVGLYAATLLPIAAGYMIAHYLTLVVAGVLWLPELVIHPVTSVQPNLAWLPVSFVWYLSVGAIVVGHIAAIALAHRIGLRDAPARPARAGLPLVVLMVGYTVLSLWIIAQPITIEPPAVPPSASTVTAAT